MDRYLPVGYELHLNGRAGKYIITGIIDKGASTVAYYADYCYDGNCTKHIIKEFNPNYISFQRSDNGEVKFNTCDESKVANAKERFILGCYNQIEIRNQIATMNQTPPIEGPFHANNTIYTDVIAYNGTTYDIANKNLSLCDRMKVCLSVAKLVKCYHEAGYLCLDIKPENIFVIPETKELLYFIDFDSVCSKEKIAFGNSISYTKQWAAPEQLNPYAMDEISEATDIYTVGELVFWSVFERHSTTEEHRGFSVYPFENIRPQVSNIFSKLFHNTLRPSVSCRFNSINNVIELLNDVVEEQSKKEYIVASAIRPKEFFIGREKELAELDKRLKDEKIIFLYGIGGIGKSEIAKQYATLNAYKYQNILYWTFNGDFESTICQDDSVSISNVYRVEDESDHSYCWRKLRAIKSCLKNNSLIIIDNLNCRLEDTLHQDVWEYLLSLPCEVIVTTRSNQIEHELPIREIADFNMLKAIFAHNCPYENNNDSYVNEIIRCVNGHTLLVELIAKQSCAAERSPKEALMLLKENGIYGIGKETIGMIKDGHRTRETVFNHVRNLFSMADMSFEQKLLITKAAFLPEVGVSSNDFRTYYRLEDNNSLNWLVENGWICRSSDPEHILSVHPVVAEIIIEFLKENIELQKAFYQDAIISMRKGYDDISVNQNVCDIYCDMINDANYSEELFHRLGNGKTKDAFQEVLQNLCKDIIYKYAKIDIPQVSYRLLCNSIVDKTFKKRIYSLDAAQYLTQFVEWFLKYGNLDYKKQLLQYAIEIYNQQGQVAYMPDREYAYLVYSILLLTQYSDYSQVIEICSNHLNSARKAKDWNMASLWCVNIARAYYNLRDTITLKYLMKRVYYLFREIMQKKKTELSNSFSLNHAKTHIQSAELNESMFDIYPPKDCQTTIWNLKLAISERKKVVGSSDMNILSENNIRIAIDEARICVLNNKYKEAQEKLCSVINDYTARGYSLTLALAATYELLGDIYMTEKRYEDSINAFQYALINNELLNSLDRQRIKAKLGRAFNLAGNKDCSQSLNFSLLSELQCVDIENLKHILADAYYNIGDYYLLIDNYSKAFEHFEYARELYETATRLRLHNNIGKARCYERIACLNCKQGDYSTGIEYMDKAISALEDMLGSENPEVIDFKNSRKQLIEN